MMYNDIPFSSFQEQHNRPTWLTLSAHNKLSASRLSWPVHSVKSNLPIPFDNTSLCKSHRSCLLATRKVYNTELRRTTLWWANNTTTWFYTHAAWHCLLHTKTCSTSEADLGNGNREDSTDTDADSNTLLKSSNRDAWIGLYNWRYSDACIPNRRKEKKKKHNNYKLKMDQLTNDRLKTSRLHWCRTYLQWLFLNSQSVIFLGGSNKLRLWCTGDCILRNKTVWLVAQQDGWSQPAECSARWPGISATQTSGPR